MTSKKRIYAATTTAALTTKTIKNRQYSNNILIQEVTQPLCAIDTDIHL